MVSVSNRRDRLSLSSLGYKDMLWSSRCGSAETNPTRNHEVSGSIPGLAQWVKDLASLWLWRRLAAAAPIRPVAWELPYTADAALKRKRRRRKKGPRVLLWHRGLGIQCCRSSGLGHSCSTGSVPGLGTFTCHQLRQKEKKKTPLGSGL